MAARKILEKFRSKYAEEGHPPPGRASDATSSVADTSNDPEPLGLKIIHDGVSAIVEYVCLPSKELVLTVLECCCNSRTEWALEGVVD
jgi:hypothetical protein